MSLSFENFQKNKDRIYRIAVEWGNDGNAMRFAGAMPAIAPAVNDQLPEVETAVRIKKDYDATIKNSDDQQFEEDELYFADPGIFDVFSFNLLQGDSKQVLTEPYSMVISKERAQKYFGNINPVGTKTNVQRLPGKYHRGYG